MKLNPVALLTVIALSACTHTPGLKSVGHDVFTLTRPVSDSGGGIKGAEKLARLDAENHCRSIHTPMIFLSSDLIGAESSAHQAVEIIFRCPSKRYNSS